MSYQYQEVASPPPQEQTAVVPDFFAAYAPNWFPPRYPQHTTAIPPAVFETLPAPIEGYAYYPDRLQGHPPQHTTATSPAQFQTLPYVWGASAFYPDRLQRSNYLWPYPEPVMNLEPIAAPAPDLGQRAVFPDRLDRLRRLYPDPQPVMNLEPIVNPAPDIGRTVYPDRLHGFKPVPFPFRFYTPTPSTFAVRDDYSRGLYLGDTRGLYHTSMKPVAEPNFTVQSVANQTIPNSTVTQIDLSAGSSHAGYGGSTADPWSLLVALDDEVQIRHTGRYVIGFRVSWEDNATGIRGVFVRVFDDTNTVIREVVRHIVPAGIVGLATMFSGVSDIQPLLAGWKVKVHVQQTSGGDLDVQILYLWGVRLAPQLPYMLT